MKTEFRHTLYCVNHTQTICDHSFIQTLTVTSSLKCSNFQWKFMFFPVLRMFLAQFSCIRFETKMMVELIFTNIVFLYYLFALPLIIICIYPMPLCSMYGLHSFVDVSLHVAFSLVYRHHRNVLFTIFTISERIAQTMGCISCSFVCSFVMHFMVCFI